MIDHSKYPGLEKYARKLGLEVEYLLVEAVDGRDYIMIWSGENVVAEGDFGTVLEYLCSVEAAEAVKLIARQEIVMRDNADMDEVARELGYELESVAENRIRVWCKASGRKHLIKVGTASEVAEFLTEQLVALGGIADILDEAEEARQDHLAGLVNELELWN
jgi:hypothetical protein